MQVLFLQAGIFCCQTFKLLTIHKGCTLQLEKINNKNKVEINTRRESVTADVLKDQVKQK